MDSQEYTKFSKTNFGKITKQENRNWKILREIFELHFFGGLDKLEEHRFVNKNSRIHFFGCLDKLEEHRFVNKNSGIHFFGGLDKLEEHRFVNKNSRIQG